MQPAGHTLIITFSTNYDAICAEKHARKHGLEGKLIPTPRSMSAGCGLAWQGFMADLETYQDGFSRQDIRWEAMEALSE